MIVVMKSRANPHQIDNAIKRVVSLGFKADVDRGTDKTIIAVLGDTKRIDRSAFSLLPGVEEVIRILKEYKLAGRQVHPRDTVITVNGIKIGSKEIIIMAGPCAVENRRQLLTTAREVKKAGVLILRGGAFKPRSSPYTFQGLGIEGLELLREAKKQTGLLIISEVMSAGKVGLVSEYADILQIGARNMSNFDLLKEVGKSGKPAMLKRGPSATIKEFLMCAEYILSEGNPHLMLCERGIRSFDSEFSRNTLDLTAVPVLKKETHLPVIVDPSHGTGRADLVIPMAKAAIAAGADGLLVEVHPHPESALSDGAQSLTPAQFRRMVKEIKVFAEVMGRSLPGTNSPRSTANGPQIKKSGS